MKKNRLEWEKEVFSKMIRIYCKGKGHPNILCDKCTKITDYAFQQIENCPFGEDKLSCSKCAVHCYQKEIRDQVKKIMRYSGPRMIFFHPIITFKHFKY